MLFSPDQKPQLDVGDQVLLDAADLLDADGWGQGWLLDVTTGHRCVDEALIEAAKRRGGNWPRVAGQTICRLDNFLGEPSADWNDYVCRSQEQAASALRGTVWNKHAS